MTVLRDGRLVKSGDITGETRQTLVSAMPGEHKSETLYPEKRRSDSRRVVPRVRGLRGSGVRLISVRLDEFVWLGRGSFLGVFNSIWVMLIFAGATLVRLTVP